MTRSGGRPRRDLASRSGGRESRHAVAFRVVLFLAVVFFVPPAVHFLIWPFFPPDSPNTARLVAETLVAGLPIAAAALFMLYRSGSRTGPQEEGRHRSEERPLLEGAPASALEAMAAAGAVLDRQGAAVRTNAAFRRLLGSDPASSSCPVPRLLGLPELTDRWSQLAEGAIGELRAGGSALVGGRKRLLDVAISAIETAPAAEPLFLVRVDDVTEGASDGGEPRKCEDFHNLAAEASQDFFLRVRPDGTVLFANRAGRELQELLGLPSEGARLPEGRIESSERERILSRRATLRPGAPEIAQTTAVVFLDGRERRLAWVEHGIFDSDGRLAELDVLGRDMTELAEARLRLEESEARYRTLFSGSTAGLVVVDRSGTIVDSNPRTADLAGRPAADLEGVSLETLFAPQDCERIRALLSPRSDPGVASPVEVHLLAADGRSTTVEVITSTMAERDGTPRLLFSFRDVTERKVQEAARAARDAELRALFHAAPIGLALFRDRVVLEANDGVTAITQYSKDEMIGRSARMFYGSDADFERVGRTLYDSNVIGAAGVSGTGVRFRRKDGRDIEVLLTAAPLDPSDLSKGAAVAILDVSEKQAIEEEIRRNDALLRLLARNAPALMWTTDEAARITSALGAPLVGQLPVARSADRHPLRWLFGADSALQTATIHHDSALEGRSSSFSFERERRYFEASLEPLRSADGTVIGVVGVAVDTTEQRLAALWSRKRRDQLQLLLSIARIALGPAETAEALRAVSDAIRRALRFPVGGIGLASPSSRETRLAAIAGMEAGAAPGTVAIPYDQTLSGHVLESERPVVLVGQTGPLPTLEAGLEGFSPGTYVGVPLRGRASPLGVVFVASPAAEAISGDTLAWLEMVADFVSIVVERRQAADQVLKLSQAVEQSPVAVLVLSREGAVEYVNPFFARKTGYPLSEMMGRDPRFLLSRGDTPIDDEVFRRSVRADQTWAGELPIRSRSGQLLWWSVGLSPVHDGRGQISTLVVVADDVTERKAADQEVRRSREKLRALWGRLAAVQEEERRALARELHEEVGQTVAGLAYGLRWLSKRIGGGPTEIQEELAALGREAGDAIERIQKMTRGLRPVSLDLDLVAALETEVAAFRRRTGIPCVLSAEPESMVLDPPQSMTVFRILQEALENAAMHGDPDEVTVRLTLDRGMLLLEVSDDGRGLGSRCPEEVEGLGLREARERAGALGGRVRLEPVAPRGLRLIAEVPVRAQHEARS